MERNKELLLKGFKAEVKEVLRNFDEIINARLGDTVTVTSNAGVITRPTTLQDTIDLYQNEWSNTVGLLDEIGINIEEDNVTPITIKVNHKAIGKELQEYADRADSNGATSYLEYKNIQIPYKKIYMEDDITGGSMLIPYAGDNVEESTAALILLDKDTEYKILNKIGLGEQPVLIEK
jgi:sporulation protein YlmC with PRC-barrel domain